MLFTYRPIVHPMDRLQAAIDHLFLEVWCKAPQAEFSIECFAGCESLQKLVTDFSYLDTKAATFFNNHIQPIYRLFSELTPQQLEQLAAWYRANNRIEALCNGEEGITPIRYAELAEWNQKISNKLKGFFSKLYAPWFLKSKPIKDQFGKVAQHYKAFVKINDEGKCPFCGLSDIESTHSTKREAYDHFLPNVQYPFNSINFRNLAPMCYKCNSSYKAQKDPIHHHNGQRRKAFYAYAVTQPQINIGVEVDTLDVDAMTPDNIQLTIQSDRPEQMQTWLSLFEIEQRYKDKLLAKNSGKAWLSQMVDECKNYGEEPGLFLTKLARNADQHPYADENFLKHPFLTAYMGHGVFDNLGEG